MQHADAGSPATPAPRSLVTRERIAADLRAAGVRAGDVVLAHVGLKQIGWVCGGPVAVVQALMDAVGDAGTLVMAAHSGDLSDPARWVNPPVPRDWWDEIRRTMPAYDPRITGTRGVGAVAEAFRTFPGVVRSAHPAVSFAAWGCRAAEVVARHPLPHGLGEESPLGRLFEMDARVVLLGCGHGSNTSLHLAEERWGGLREIEQGAPVVEDGARVWRTFRETEYDSDDFEALGADYDRARGVVPGRVGDAACRVLPMRDVVAFGTEWIRARRGDGRGV